MLRRFLILVLLLTALSTMNGASHGPPAQGGDPLPVPLAGPRNPIASDFVFTQELVPNLDLGTFVGYSVDIDGDVAVVGAPLTYVNNEPFSGAVYIYRRTFTPGPVWTLEQTLTLASPTPTGFTGDIDNQQFGVSVAIDGTKLVVGAPRRVINSPEQGAIFFYEYVGGTWIFRSFFTVLDGEFGADVALDGNYAVASDPAYDDYRGMVKIYSFGGTTWSEVQTFTQPEGVALSGTSFGFGLALDGDILLVGQPNWRESDTAPSDTGRAWIYRKGGGGTFAFDQAIEAPEVAASNVFGLSVDVYDGVFEDLFFVGMPTTFGLGKAFMFAETTANGFQLINTLGDLSGSFGSAFGAVVAIDRQDTLRAVVASPGLDKVTVLERTGTGSGQPFFAAAQLPYSSTAGNTFGFDLAIDNYTMNVGGIGNGAGFTGYALIIDEYGLGINTSTVSQPLEEGDSIFYTVRLTRRPTANVTLTPSQPFGGSTVGQCDNFSDTLTFTPTNYASEQAVLATVVQDTAAEGFHACTISNNYTSTDPNYTENFLNGREVSFYIIDDDEIVPSLTINDPAGYECTDGYSRDLPFVVTLSSIASNTVSVDWETFPDTAVENVDYDYSSGTLNIPPGNSQGVFMVEMRCDDLFEGSESFSVSLSDPVNATIADGGGFGEIINDDPKPSITVTTPTQTEGDSGNTTFTVTVAFASPTELDGAFMVSTVDSTAVAGSDYQALSTFSPLTIPASTGSMSFDLTVFGDTTVESDETFAIRISPAADEANFYLPGDAAYLDYPVTILNDDSASVPAVSVSDQSITECDGPTGNTTMTFTLSLSEPAPGPASVIATTIPGTALAIDDYEYHQTTVWFSTGETTRPFVVYTYCDDIPEANETFNVSLTSPNSLTVADGTGVGTLLDTDTGPAVSISDLTASECSGGGTFTANVTVNLSFGLTMDVDVDFETADITALAGSDYVAKTGTVTFGILETSKTIGIDIVCDNTVEPDETFAVNLTASTFSTIADSSATVTLEDDDSAPVVPAATVGDSITTECSGAGSTSITFPVNLDQAATGPVSFDYETSDLTATAGSDYLAKSGTVTFAIGQLYQPITVIVLCDATDEPNETFAVELVSMNGGTISDGVGIGTIMDDDDPLPSPIVSVTDAGGYECSPMPFYVTKPIISVFNLASGSVTVDWELSSTSATAGEDYVDASGSVTLTPAQPFVEVPVIILCDEVVEPDESVQIVVTGVSDPAVTIVDGTGNMDIANDDPNANSATITYLLQNGGFETPVNGTDWSIVSGPASRADDKVKCNKPAKNKFYSAERNCAFVFKGGTSENSQLKQAIAPAGSEATGSPLVFWMLYKSGSVVDATAGVKVKYSDGTATQKIQANLVAANAGFADFVTFDLLTSGAVKKYNVFIKHKSTSGKLTVDVVSLYLDQPAGSPRSLEALPVPQSPAGFRGNGS